MKWPRLHQSNRFEADETLFPLWVWTEISELRESDKLLKHELRSIWRSSLLLVSYWLYDTSWSRTQQVASSNNTFTVVKIHVSCVTELAEFSENIWKVNAIKFLCFLVKYRWKVSHKNWLRASLILSSCQDVGYFEAVLHRQTSSFKDICSFLWIY